jgi:hypothetical protein
VEAEIRERAKGQEIPEGADGRAKGSPIGPGGLKQAYFVFCKKDEIAIRICSEIAFGCSFAESSERFQSALVIVLKSGSPGGVRKDGAEDRGGLSGEGIFHGSAMRETFLGDPPKRNDRLPTSYSQLMRRPAAAWGQR